MVGEERPTTPEKVDVKGLRTVSGKVDAKAGIQQRIHLSVARFAELGGAGQGKYQLVPGGVSAVVFLGEIEMPTPGPSERWIRDCIHICTYSTYLPSQGLLSV
jgi:hypothetical protein